MKKYIFLPRISERTARALPARLFAVGLSLIFAEQFAARLLLDGAIRSEMSLCGRLLVCSTAAEYTLAALCVLVGGVLLLVVGTVVYSMIRDRKKGKSACSCGGDCSHCKGCH